MPQQRIEYGGQIHEFPDSFTDADISDALSQIDTQQQFGDVQSGASTTAGPGLMDVKYSGMPVTPNQGMEILKGVPKKVGEVVQGGGQLVESMLGMPTSPPRMTPVPSMATPIGQRVPGGRDVFQANTPYEQIGKTLGGIGMTLAGGAAAGPATAAGPAGMAQLAAQGVGGGMVGALQNPDSPIAPFIGGAAAPVIGAGIGEVGSRLAKNETVAKLYNALAKVGAGRKGTQFDTAAGEFKTLPGRAMVNPEEGTFSQLAKALTTSPQKAGPAAAKELQGASDALAQQLAKSKATLDIYKVIPMDEPAAFTKFNSALEATGLGTKDLTKLTPSEVNALRSELGNRINWSPNAMATDANEALKDTYSNLNKLIGESVEGVKPTLKRLQEALLYNRALEHTIEQGAGKYPTMIRALKKLALLGAGGAAGAEVYRRVTK